jgi:magnesium chelatase subunit I
LRENLAVPRISDLSYIHSSTGGKIELEGFEDDKESKIMADLIKKAVLNVFNRYYQLDNLAVIVAQFSEGLSVEVSDMMSAKSYVRTTKNITDLGTAVRILNIPESLEAVASAVEFILEGLHLNRKLNKAESKGKSIYRR